ncbi:acyltransferase family protein [Martelella alba]|uniref:Acyltransferase n=1 Tax=Martelella alba TaxID=2590451 RepID=A0ABY2STJ1_9HYPH|nr:acyltransferase [Martelella alba]TKI08333.1 acyltransferase [Martelella alba]
MSFLIHMMNNNKNYFPELDGLRFFAALFVAVFHLCYWSSFLGTTPGRFFHNAANYNEIKFISQVGWIGVEIFFVISGFVISNSSLGKKPLTFLFKRALRIYPAIWCCATITLMVMLMVGKNLNLLLVKEYFHTLFFIPNSDRWIGWIDGSYWTLMYEVSFYFLIFISLFFSDTLTLGRIATILSILSFIYMVFMLFSNLFQQSYVVGKYISFVGENNYIFYNFMQFRHGSLFSTGMFIFLSRTRSLNFYEKITFLISIIGGSIEVYIHAFEFMNSTKDIYLWEIPVLIWLFSVIVIFVVSKKSFINTSNGMLSEILRKMGLMTYPFYLLHAVTGSVVLRLMVDFGINKWISLLMVIIIIGFLSYVICIKIEPCIREFLVYKISGKKSSELKRNSI